MGAVNFHYPRCSCNRSRKTDENNMTDIGDWIPGITERTYDSPTLQKFVRSARQRELYGLLIFWAATRVRIKKRLVYTQPPLVQGDALQKPFVF